MLALFYYNTVIRKNFEQAENAAKQPVQAVVRTMISYRMALRVAAAVMIPLGSATIYKCDSIDTQSLYKQQYNSYELGTTRGSSVADAQAVQTAITGIIRWPLRYHLSI
jgi:hypothetical protein